MKKPTTMTRTQKKLTNMHSAGFRDGCEVTAQGLFATMRVLGFKALADELERRERPAYRELSPFAECLVKPTRVGKGKKAKLVFRRSKEARALKRVSIAYVRCARAEARALRLASRLLRKGSLALVSLSAEPSTADRFHALDLAFEVMRAAHTKLRRALREVQ